MENQEKEVKDMEGKEAKDIDESLGISENVVFIVIEAPR